MSIDKALSIRFSELATIFALMYAGHTHSQVSPSGD
jgi:hypothetical protein